MAVLDITITNGGCGHSCVTVELDEEVITWGACYPTNWTAAQIQQDIERELVIKAPAGAASVTDNRS